MDKTQLSRTVSSALSRAGDAGTVLSRSVSDGVNSIHWQQLVPEARRMLDVGAKLAIAREGVRLATRSSRQHPVAVVAGAAALVGIGVGIWLALRNRSQGRTIEGSASSSKTGNGDARRKATPASARKSTTKRAPAKKSGGSARKSAGRNGSGSTASS